MIKLPPLVPDTEEFETKPNGDWFRFLNTFVECKEPFVGCTVYPKFWSPKHNTYDVKILTPRHTWLEFSVPQYIECIRHKKVLTKGDGSVMFRCKDWNDTDWQKYLPQNIWFEEAGVDYTEQYPNNPYKAFVPNVYWDENRNKFLVALNEMYENAIYKTMAFDRYVVERETGNYVEGDQAVVHKDLDDRNCEYDNLSVLSFKENAYRQGILKGTPYKEPEFDLGLEGVQKVIQSLLYYPMCYPVSINPFTINESGSINIKEGSDGTKYAYSMDKRSSYGITPFGVAFI